MIRSGHCRISKRVMKKRSWGLQVDPNINLLSKKNRYLRSERFFAKLKKPIFNINVRILYRKRVRLGHCRKSKRVMNKRSWGL